MEILPEIKIFLIAMAPVIELRGAIPVALSVYNLPVWSAFLFSVLGNLVPPILIILFLEKASVFLSRRVYFLNRFFVWFFEKTKKKHEKKFEFWRSFALVVLTAIPLPFTGAWTCAICAFIFGIPLKKAFPLISLGVFIAGIIVALLTLGIIDII